jgi:hypothetical protein
MARKEGGDGHGIQHHDAHERTASERIARSFFDGFFSFLPSSNFAIIPAPGFLWPDCVCMQAKRSILGRSEERRTGFGVAYRAFGEDMALGSRLENTPSAREGSDMFILLSF